MSGIFDDAEKEHIRSALRTKEAYVQRILEQDLIILGLIDDAKSKIIRELKDVSKARRALSGYKAAI